MAPRCWQAPWPSCHKWRAESGQHWLLVERTTDPLRLRSGMTKGGVAHPSSNSATFNALTLRSCFAGERTADPSAAPDFLSRLVASRTPCGFPYRKPHTLLSLAPRTGNPGTLGMTKGTATLASAAVIRDGESCTQSAKRTILPSTSRTVEEGTNLPFVVPTGA